MSDIAPCPTCNEPISRNAKSCPHCGETSLIFPEDVKGCFGCFGISFLALLVAFIMDIY